MGKEKRWQAAWCVSNAVEVVFGARCAVRKAVRWSHIACR